MTKRTLACCIPIRQRRGSAGVTLDNVQVMLVSSRREGKELLFPKGGWENGESIYAAAEREAFEEAGIKGVLEKPHFAVYEYHSRKKKEPNGESSERIVYVFLLHVHEELEEWPEKVRTRHWMDVHRAKGQLKHAWMKQALDDLIAIKKWT